MVVTVEDAGRRDCNVTEVTGFQPILLQKQADGIDHQGGPGGAAAVGGNPHGKLIYDTAVEIAQGEEWILIVEIQRKDVLETGVKNAP